MNIITDILIAAKANIDTPEKWIQCTSALDANGKSVHPSSSAAVCYCSSGAVYKAAANESYLEECRVYALACQHIISAIRTDSTEHVSFFEIITDWNDNTQRTHAEVMNVFDKAIELSKEVK